MDGRLEQALERQPTAAPMQVGLGGTHAEAALETARRSGTPAAFLRDLDVLGMIAVVSGAIERGDALLRAVLALANRSGGEVRAHRLREKLVYSYLSHGQIEEAEAVAADALAQVSEGRVPERIDAIATHVARTYLGVARERWSVALHATAAGLVIAQPVLPVARQG